MSVSSRFGMRKYIFFAAALFCAELLVAVGLDVSGITTIDGIGVLESVANKEASRVSVDVDVALDLSDAEVISFDFRSSDITKFASATLYLKSGKGWYSTDAIELGATSVWQRVNVKMCDIKKTEGAPVGLDQVDRIRLSCWRMGTDKDSLKIEVAKIAVHSKSSSKKKGNSSVQKDKLKRTVLAEFKRTAKPRKGERFAVWCHNPYRFSEKWDETLKTLAAAGCTDFLPNLCWGGHAFYDSKILPVHYDVAKHGDAFEHLRKACSKYGVKLHVWRVCGKLSKSKTPKEYLRKLDAENRLAVQYDGTKIDGWVCLSHPANIELEIAAMEELAAKGATGVHFDYIRYFGEDTCFCDGCRERFEKFANVAVADWPKEIRKNKRLKAKWDEFRCANITKIVRETRKRVKRKNPKCEISAAVFKNFPKSLSEIGQDPEIWCKEGLLDFLCPMNYSRSSLFYENAIRVQKKLVHNVPMLPGIGLSCWPDDGKDIERVTEQIKAARRLGVAGWTIFDLNERGYSVIKLLVSPH